MWIVVFLIALGLDPIFSNEDQNSNVTNPTEAELDRIMEEFLASFTEAQMPSKHRTKRDTSSYSKIPLTDDVGVDRLQTISPVSHLCNSSLFTKFLDVNNMTYAICVSEATMDSPAEVIVGVYEEHAWIPFNIKNWYVMDPQGLVAFHSNGNIFILIAERDKAPGTSLTRIDLTSRDKVPAYLVDSKHATSISLWEMKIFRKFHLAIANSAGYKDLSDMVSEVYIYEWLGDTYFDRYDIIQAYDVKSIEPFHIHNDAYLAIANYRKGKHSFKVDSEIFKYSLDKKGWISTQKIPTNGAMQWKFFSLGQGLDQEFFLAVANRGDYGQTDSTSMIYKFAKDKFVPFQCLETSSATSIASLPLKNGILLAVADYTDFVQLYQYDGWRFVKTSVQYSHGSMSSGVNYLTFHNVVHNSQLVPILSVSNPRKPYDKSVFELGFQHENVLNDWYTKSKDWCKNTLDQVESLDTQPLSNLLDDVIYIDQPNIEINGSLTFEDGFSTHTLQTQRLTEIVTNEVYDSSMLETLQKLRDRLEIINEKLMIFQETLNNSLRIDGNQTITGELFFQDVVFDCNMQPCHFDNIYTDILNGEDVSDWKNNLVFLDDDKAIDGTIAVDQIKANSIEVRGLINGLDPSTFVTKTGNHIITGHKHFKEFVTVSDLEVDGLVDGIKISPDNVLLTTGYQNVTGSIIFDEVETSGLEVDVVNGRNLAMFFEDIVRTDRPAEISGDKTFENLVVDNLILSPGSKINGIDIVDLYNNAWWKNDYNVEILAPMTFQNVTIEKNVFAPFGINGIQIPGPRVVDITKPATIVSDQEFRGVTTMKNLTVLGSLNGLRVLEHSGYPPLLDILLNTGDQVITGEKTFDTIYLEKDSFVKGTVDGVDLSAFMEMTLSKNKDIDVNRTWTFNNLIINGPLNAAKISGYDINDIYERALKLTDTNLPDMVFKEDITVNDLESYDINGIDIERDIVLKNKDQVLTGTKTFTEIVLEENSVILGTVNNVSMKFLNESILRIGNQALESKTLTGDVRVGNITVLGSINGVPVDDIVTLDGDQDIFFSRNLHNVTFNRIKANNLHVAGTVNGINVDAMIKDTMTKDGREEVTGTLTVLGDLHVGENDNLQVGNINGVNIQELWDDAVLRDVPQNISGAKTFTDSVEFEHLVFQNTLDGVSQWEMQNWMLKDVSQTVEADVIFTNGLSANDLRVNGLINGKIDIVKLNNSIVKVNEPVVIEGPVRFQSLISNGDITLTGNIQGIKLSEEAVTKSGEKIVSGVKTFTGNLTITGDAVVEGLVDGVSIPDLCSKAVLIDHVQNISRLTIQGDVTFLSGGTVGGNVAGVDLLELQKIATADNGEIVFTGEKVFENLTIEGPITIEGKLGDVDIHHLNKTYMSLTRDQEIIAPMFFDEVNFEGKLLATNFNTSDQMINGINLTDLNQRIMKTNGHQNITAIHHFDDVVFESDVFVSGNVNGLNLPYGVMVKNQTNFVQTPKIFEKPVHVLGNIIMANGSLIQDVDVSDWARKAVKNDGGTYHLRGKKTFYNLTVNDARVEGLLDNVKISKDDLLLVYDDQVVTGIKTFVNDVEVSGSITVKGLINGQDLNLLSTQTMQRNKNNVVSGTKKFVKPLTIKDLTAPSVKGIRIEDLVSKVNTPFDFARVENKIKEVGTVIDRVQDVLKRQAVVFQYYELFQEFNIPTALDWLYVPTNEQELLLLSDSSCSYNYCSSVRVFKYSNENQEFEPYQEVPASNGVVMKYLKAWNAIYLIVAGNDYNPDCNERSEVTGYRNATATVYRWNGKTLEYVHSLNDKPTVHMVTFVGNKLACVVFLQLEQSQVYCLKEHTSEFQYHETLSTRGGRKASVVNYEGRILLAMTSEDLTPRTDNIEWQPVEIHAWNFEQSTFIPVQKISTIFATSVLLMGYKTDYSSDIFLAISEGQIPRIRNSPKLLIYRYDFDSMKFNSYQEINDSGELESISLTTGELILFCLNKLTSEIKLYQLKGVSGFMHIDTVKSFGSTSLHAFIRHMDERDYMNHYLAIAGPLSLMAKPAQGTDYAKILKSKMRGRLT